MCNPLQKLPLLLFFKLPPHCCLSLSLCEGNHTGRRAKVAITLPVNSSARTCSHTELQYWPVGTDPRQHGAQSYQECPPPFLCCPEPDYSLLACRLKPLPPVTPLLPHSTGFWCSQTQSAHLAPNQTIPKIDKQLWVRMDVQMGREGKSDRQAEREEIVWER